MSRPPSLVLDVGRHRLLAVEVRGGRGGWQVRRRVEVPIPSSVAEGGDEARGAWVARTLAEHGMGGGRAILVIDRAAVTFKTLELPTVEAGELPDMVRLALQRDLPIDVEQAVIDFMVVHQGERSTSVMAVAAPGAAVEALRTMANAAGVRVARISPRAPGVASLLGTPDNVAGTVVAIDLTGEGVEVTLLEEGAVRLSRGATHAPGDEPASGDHAIVTEIRRTWLSHTAQHQAARTVRRAIILGDDERAAAMAPAIAGIVEAPVEILQHHPGLAAGDRSPGALWPLLGMAMATEGDTIDLAHPRRAPDTAARRRQAVLLAVAALVIASLTGYTLGVRTTRAEIARRDDLAGKAGAASPEAWRFQREEVRLRHLETWALSEWDWLERLRSLDALLPEPGEAVLDAISAKRDTESVRWVRDGGWDVQVHTRVVLEGEARSRRRADELRDRLLAESGYVVTTSGSDGRGGTRLPFAFGYLLQKQESLAPASGRRAATAPRSRDGAADAAPAEGATS